MKIRELQKFISTIVILFVGINLLNKLFCSNIISYGIISLMIYLLMLLWTKYLWRIDNLIIRLIANIIGLYKYPNLNGMWEMKYWSSYKFDDINNQYIISGKGLVEIDQVYSKIFIKGQFEESSNFESFFVELKQKENKVWMLIYAYRNKPKDIDLINSPSGGMHEGFAYLELKDKKTLECYYSNDENRKTRGKLLLKKCNN